jgi:hypothetical protein
MTTSPRVLLRIPCEPRNRPSGLARPPCGKRLKQMAPLSLFHLALVRRRLHVRPFARKCENNLGPIQEVGFVYGTSS